MLLFTAIGPISLSESQYANCFISLAAIGGLLLLYAIGVHLWRMWENVRSAKKIAVGDLHADFAVGVRLEDRPQSSGVIDEEREWDARMWSTDTLVEEHLDNWIESNDGTLELRTPPRAYIR